MKTTVHGFGCGCTSCTFGHAPEDATPLDQRIAELTGERNEARAQHAATLGAWSVLRDQVVVALAAFVAVIDDSLYGRPPEKLALGIAAARAALGRP